MKRNSLRINIYPYLKFSLITMLALSLCSCGYFSRRSKDFNQNEAVSKTVDPNVPVSKKQYNELLAKYNALAAQMGQTRGERVSENLINELASSPKAELAETVDVFDTTLPKFSSNKSSVIINDPSLKVSDSKIENYLQKLKRAEDYIEAGKFNKALGLIKKDIENSPVKQIRVKAKFLLGELLLRQNEYDLAMQIFEEVIGNYAFSGLVIKTLGRLIHCSEKLKLESKKEKYYSMLNDIFGTG